MASIVDYFAFQLHRLRFRRFLGARALSPRTAFKPGPLPPDELIRSTSLLTERELARKHSPYKYYGSGLATLGKWLGWAEAEGFRLSGAEHIFELGCGSGRLVRHLRAIPNLSLSASDVNAQAVAWCQANLPGIDFHVNDVEPPLPYEADSFDLIIAQSVFTHIQLSLQDAWLAELRRVLRPGGYLLANVLGRRHQRAMLDAEELEQLEEAGSYELDWHNPHASFSTQQVKSWDVFQTPEHVREAFSSHFTICRVQSDGLDLLILRKS